jgi:hypothetical protein
MLQAGDPGRRHSFPWFSKFESMATRGREWLPPDREVSFLVGFQG